MLQERRELKRESDRLRDRAMDLRENVDRETLAFLNAQNTAHALKGEIEFFKQVADQVPLIVFFFNPTLRRSFLQSPDFRVLFLFFQELFSC